MCISVLWVLDGKYCTSGVNCFTGIHFTLGSLMTYSLKVPDRTNMRESCQAGHTPKCNICHLKPIKNLYTYFMAPPSLWLDPDAPEPLSGEKPNPVGEKAFTVYCWFRLCS